MVERSFGWLTHWDGLLRDRAGRFDVAAARISIDTNCCLLTINLAPAHVQDAAGAELVVKTICKRWPSLKHRLAEGAHDRDNLINAVAYHSFSMKVVRKLTDQQDLQALRRWMVERTFGWVTCWRRLVRDDERRGPVSEAMIHISICALLVRRSMVILKQDLRRWAKSANRLAIKVYCRQASNPAS